MQRMSDAAKRAQSAYMREWRKKNPDKDRAARARYWERKAVKMQKEGERHETSEK